MGTTESNADTNIRTPHYSGGVRIGAGSMTLTAHHGNKGVNEVFALSPGHSRLFAAICRTDGLTSIPSPYPGRYDLIDVPAIADLMTLIFGLRWTTMVDALGFADTQALIIGWTLQQRYPLLGA